MAATNYPTIAELQAYLLEIGTGTTYMTLTLRAAIEEAISYVESRTGRVFTTSDLSETRYFDVPGPQSLQVFVPIQDCWTITNVAASGQNLTLNTDYVTYPRPIKSGAAFDALELLTVSPYGVRTVAVTGKFGWASVPAVIQSVIIKRAAASLLTTSSASVGGVVTEQKIGDRSIRFEDGKDSAAVLRMEVERIIQPFIKVPYV